MTSIRLKIDAIAHHYLVEFINGDLQGIKSTLPGRRKVLCKSIKVNFLENGPGPLPFTHEMRYNGDVLTSRTQCPNGMINRLKKSPPGESTSGADTFVLETGLGGKAEVIIDAFVDQAKNSPEGVTRVAITRYGGQLAHIDTSCVALKIAVPVPDTFAFGNATIHRMYMILEMGTLRPAENDPAQQMPPPDGDGPAPVFDDPFFRLSKHLLLSSPRAYVSPRDQGSDMSSPGSFSPPLWYQGGDMPSPAPFRRIADTAPPDQGGVRTGAPAMSSAPGSLSPPKNVSPPRQNAPPAQWRLDPGPVADSEETAPIPLPNFPPISLPDFPPFDGTFLESWFVDDGPVRAIIGIEPLTRGQ